jgi:ribosome recycling factor
MLEEVFADTKDRMSKTVEAVIRDFGGIRTGKASVHLLDVVKVDAYGSKMPINQLGTVSIPEPRLLVVQVFDKTTVGDIAKAIQVADLGLNPMVDGQTIRIPVPALNEERRKDLVKRCKTVAEDGRVAIRNIRRDANDQVKKTQKAKEISEDQETDGFDEIQKHTDEFIKQIDEFLVRKEKDVMEV